jgi:hypothetical protein
MTDPTTPADAGFRLPGWLRRHRDALLLALYAVLLVVLRPHDPFEWNEVQYLRALDSYNVAAHSPHPPGAPLFIAAARLLKVVLRDGVLALQTVSIVAALAALALLRLLVKREGGRDGAALGAACGLAVAPGFVFYANVGLPEVAALAVSLGAVWLGVRALDEDRLLLAAALAATAACGVSPRFVVFLLPMIVWVTVSAVRRRCWRPLALAGGVALAATALIWLPAILLTGWGMYWRSLAGQLTFMIHEARLAFPTTPLGAVAPHWLVHPFGKLELAIPAWLLALAGAVAWWRGGARRLVLVAGTTLVVYTAGTMTSLMPEWGVIASIPAMAMVAVLAAGNLTWERRPVRLSLALVMALLGVALLGWSKGALLVRRTPAPVWSALEYVRDNFDPARTAVSISGGIDPHAGYVLGRAGFTLEPRRSEEALLKLRSTGKEVVFLSSFPIPGAQVVKETSWSSPRLLQLAYGRYGRCLVQRQVGNGPRYSPSFEAHDGNYFLAGWGGFDLPAGARPRIATVCPVVGKVEVRSATMAQRAVASPDCLLVPLGPGPDGAVTVHTLSDAVLLRPITFEELETALPAGLPAGAVGVASLPPKATWLLPVVAHAAGHGGAQWRTRLLLSNASYSEGRLTLGLLPTGASNGMAVGGMRRLVAGATLTIEDVLASEKLLPGGRDATGALLLGISDPSGKPFEDLDAVHLEAATYDAAAKAGPDAAGGELPVVDLTSGLTAGSRARLELGAGRGTARIAAGVVLLGGGPATVEVTPEDRQGRLSKPWVLTVSTAGHIQGALDLGADVAALRVVVVRAPTGSRVYPYLSLVDNASGATRYVVPSVSPAGNPPALPLVALLTPWRAAGAR